MTGKSLSGSRRHLDGSNRKTTRGRRTENRRRLLVEQLEIRTLMAGDVLAPAMVSVRLEAADPVTLKPLAEIHPGDDFAVVAYARDLREQAQGVFSVYFDLEYAKDLATVAGPIVRRGAFTNDATGDVLTPGLVDELGGFSESLKPPSIAREQLIAAVPFRATSVGVFELKTDAAESFGHDVLVYGSNLIISPESVRLGNLRLEITDVSTNLPRLDALDDDFVIQENSAGTVLDVLGNDVSPMPQLTIASVDSANLVGHVEISSDKRTLVYTPRQDFTGTEVFHYTAIDDRAQSDAATVTLYVRSGEVAELQSAVHLSLADGNGNPITSLREGDEFVLLAAVQDLRPEALGVFAAYLDVAYTSTRAKVIGPIVFDGSLSNGNSGDVSAAGFIDEVGGFQSTLTPVGGGLTPVFRVPMVATHAGTAIFQAGPSDELPQHQWLLFDRDQPVDPSQIEYDRVDVVIHSRMSAVDDSFDLAAAGGSVTLPVVANDVSRSAASLRIMSIDSASAGGSISIAPDRQSLIYERRPDFFGSEQFRYVVSDGSVSDVAEVTVHVQPAAALNDSMQIRLQITDLSGAPKSSVVAGEEFEVRASVQDLRSILVGDAGVFATYLDLLYDAASVSLVSSANNPRGIELTFGPEFKNVASGDGHVPGIIDEVGAVQSSLDPLGSGEHLLFTARFQASAGRAVTDHFSATEDTTVELDVLANDTRNQGTINFKSDPADRLPGHEILMFDRSTPVAIESVRYGSTTLEVSGDEVSIASVGTSRYGGTVTIAGDGKSVFYSPPANFQGTDEFTYSLGAGAEALVHVTVGNTNDAPQSQPDTYVAALDTTLAVDARHGVLANDIDVDRDTLRAELVSSTTHGELTLAPDGSFSFHPDEGFRGHDSFTYRALDEESSSQETTVRIEVVSPPARIRLRATDVTGTTITSIDAGEKLVLHATVQDTRDDSRDDRGVGAAYLDVEYDASVVRPATDANNPFGFDITFGTQYQNARIADFTTPGKLNDVGALQTKLTPLGRDEAALFTIEFDSALRAESDSFRVNKNSTVNLLDVLANEKGVVWDVEFAASDGGNSPRTDVVLFEPTQAVPADDVLMVGTSVEVRNSEQLTVISVDPSLHGGTVTIDSATQQLRYIPADGFVGEDSFAYVVQDEHGKSARGTVTIQVIDSWTNQRLIFDTNGDSVLVPADALVLINDLNTNGIRKLPGQHDGSKFLDVNGDGHATPQDVLLIINELNRRAAAAAEGEAADETGPTTVSDQAARRLDAAFGAFWMDEVEQRSSASRSRRANRAAAASDGLHDGDSLERTLDDLENDLATDF